MCVVYIWVCVCVSVHVRVTWRVHVWHDAFVWTYSYVGRESFLCEVMYEFIRVTWGSRTCDTKQSHASSMQHDSFIRLWHDSVICVKGLMTYWCTCRDLCITQQATQRHLWRAPTHCNTQNTQNRQCKGNTDECQRTARNCNTLQCTQNRQCKGNNDKCQHTTTDTATRCNTLQRAATRCNALQHAVTHCHKLQHTHNRQRKGNNDERRRANCSK